MCAWGEQRGDAGARAGARGEGCWARGAQAGHRLTHRRPPRIVLHVSSTFASLELAVAGVATLALGLVHLAIPRSFDFPMAIGRDGAVAFAGGFAALAITHLGLAAGRLFP